MSEAVLVTGASSGIGAAVVARLAAAGGFRIHGASRRAPPWAPPGTESVALDVRDEAQVRASVERIERESGALDALVLSAGYGIFGSVEETTLEDARAQFETNVFGALACLRAALPGMRERGRGRIVIVGSLAGRAPIPFQGHYSASKAAVDALAQALRMETAPHGIHVSLVEPGDIRTAFNDATDFAAASGSRYGARIARCEAVIRESLPKAPGPEVVADVVLGALRARWPRARYAVGPDSWLVPLARRLLPDRVGHRLIRHHFRV